MKPVVINGDVWKVVSVPPYDPGLIDRTGKLRLATTDPVSRTIRISSVVRPSMLDKVVLHEIAHAITLSYGLLDGLYAVLPEKFWVFAEEWAAQLVENHSIEATLAASAALGRSVCVKGQCVW